MVTSCSVKYLNRFSLASARLAESLPKLGTDLARILRDTEKLKDVAGSLRQAQKGIDSSLARWPELRTTLSRSATLLKATQQQMRHVIEHRDDYERALGDTIALTDEFADRLPRFTTHLDKIKDQVQLKGFRKGKVPIAHIKKVFGRSVMNEVLEETIRETSDKAIRDRKERPAMVWPDAHHPTKMRVGGVDLMILHPDGSEEVLVPGGKGQVIACSHGSSVRFLRLGINTPTRPKAPAGDREEEGGA